MAFPDIAADVINTLLYEEDEVWKHVDDILLRVWEMRYLPPKTRKCSTNDMRTVLDYLSEQQNTIEAKKGL